MADEKKPVAKVVWILGAGFSVGLGGPLLKDLLHPRTEKDFRSNYPLAVKTAHTLVLNIFKRHHPDYKAEFNSSAPTMWQHAEEFLDFLDCARVAGSSHARLFEAHFGTSATPTELHRAACQIVAAECLFTDLRSDLKGEGWQPYLRWARWLTENDTIVTFNYDRVLDMLATSEWIKHDCGAVGDAQALNPRSFLIPGIQEPANGFAKVYQLHGSVDWIAAPEDETKVMPKLLKDIIEGDHMPLIAAPGPTKDLHSRGVLATTWSRALGAIRDANVIIFMGYRFPPSDSESRRKLLEAIDNVQARHVRVQTVLGPRKNEDDTVRLQALLETMLTARRVEFENLQRTSAPFGYISKPFGDDARPNYLLRVHPLYVQDFMTVLHNDLLIGSHMLRRKPKHLSV